MQSAASQLARAARQSKLSSAIEAAVLWMAATTRWLYVQLPSGGCCCSSCLVDEDLQRRMVLWVLFN